MHTNLSYTRILFCLLSAWCVFLQAIPGRTTQSADHHRETSLLSAGDTSLVAVPVKDAADTFRLSRRELIPTRWQLVPCAGEVVPQRLAESRGCESAAFPLSEFARRQVAGVLLS